MTTATKNDKLNYFGRTGRMIKEPTFRIEADIGLEVWGGFSTDVKSPDEILFRLEASTHQSIMSSPQFLLDNWDVTVTVEPTEHADKDFPAYEFTIGDLVKLSHNEKSSVQREIEREDLDVDINWDEDIEVSDFQTN